MTSVDARAGSRGRERGASEAPAGADAPPLSTRWSPVRPVDLRLSLRPLGRGPGDPTMRWEPGALWRVMCTPAGASTVRMVQTRDAIEALAWGDGAEWAIAHLPQLLGDGDDDEGFDVADVPFLADARHRLDGMRLARANCVFEMMVAAILEQKVTTLEARRAWRQLVAKYGDAPPGPAPVGMRVFPRAEVWRMIPSWEWHKAGVGPQRSRTVLAAAAVATGLERTLVLGRGGDEVSRRLRSVPGVGVWTAAETSQRAHGDADAVSVGDYHLPALVGWALAGSPVDDDGMLELLEPWRGHRQRVMRLIEQSGFRKPRFGPRITIQDHRGH